MGRWRGFCWCTEFGGAQVFGGFLAVILSGFCVYVVICESGLATGDSFF